MNQKEYKKKNLISNICYYFDVWVAILKKSLSKSVTYRFEFMSKLMRTLLILAMQLILINSIYAGTEYVAGWSVYDYYLLLGIYNLVNYISWGIFNVNLWRLEERVVKGEFDFFLLYPTGSIFTTSFYEFYLDDAIASLSGVVLIGFYLVNNMAVVTFEGVLATVIALIGAFVIWFAMHLTIAAFNFVILKNGLLDLLKSFARVGSFPPDIFAANVRFILYSFFPVAFIAAVPSRLLSGVYSWNFVVLTLVVAVLMYIFATNVWNWSIRNYTSAGG